MNLPHLALDRDHSVVGAQLGAVGHYGGSGNERRVHAVADSEARLDLPLARVVVLRVGDPEHGADAGPRDVGHARVVRDLRVEARRRRLLADRRERGREVAVVAEPRCGVEIVVSDATRSP
jgi:hypothetical protein